MAGLLAVAPILGLAAAAALCRWPPRPLAGRLVPLVLACVWLALGAALGLLAFTLLNPGHDVVVDLPGWYAKDVAPLVVGLNADTLSAACLALIAGLAAVMTLRALDGATPAGALAGPLAVASAA